MGMSGYVMDAEERLIEICENIAKESESFQEFCEVAVLKDGMVPHMSPSDIANMFGEIWNDVWSKYNV